MKYYYYILPDLNDGFAFAINEDTAEEVLKIINKGFEADCIKYEYNEVSKDFYEFINNSGIKPM